jgi:hypothetical protein
MSEFTGVKFGGGGDGIECCHCGGFAVFPDEKGSSAHSGTTCAECGIEGEITSEGYFTALPSVFCDRDVCHICSDH